MTKTSLRMEVKKITDWNRIGVRTKEQPKNRWRDEAIKDLKKRRKIEKLDPYL